jgi:hypothetical protein
VTLILVLSVDVADSYVESCDLKKLVKAVESLPDLSQPNLLSQEMIAKDKDGKNLACFLAIEVGKIEQQ